VAHFDPGDTIDLAGVVANAAALSGGTLTLTDNGSPVASVGLTTTGGGSFGLSPDTNGGNLLTLLPSVPDDFTSNGFSDLLWRNGNGEPFIWETTVTGGGLTNPGPSWHIKAIGDFYDNGYADILWQNTNGAAYIWEMNGTNVVGGGSLGDPGPSWHAIATGDFYDNGHSDILWQNTNGAAYIWEMNGTNVVGGGSIGNPGPHLACQGDRRFLRQRPVRHRLAERQRSGLSLGNEWDRCDRRRSVGNPGPSWHVMGTGGYNGSGQDDILFQNTNGAVAVWQVSGTHIISSASLANPGPTWHV
jgi:hypothetical protein